MYEFVVVVIMKFPISGKIELMFQSTDMGISPQFRFFLITLQLQAPSATVFGVVVLGSVYTFSEGITGALG